MTNIAKPTDKPTDEQIKAGINALARFGYPIPPKRAMRAAYEAMIEAASEAIHDFLDERFPEGAMPGGQQLFADDHLDAEFKHEAGCDELAKVALEAALRSSAPQEPDDELIERLKDMRDFCRGTTHTHPHLNNVARLCEDVLAVLQAKAPETDWQPIETAPEDEFVIGWRKDWSRPSQVIFCAEVGKRKRRWGFSSLPFSELTAAPTLWQPLPQAPETGEPQ